MLRARTVTCLKRSHPLNEECAAVQRHRHRVAVNQDRLKEGNLFVCQQVLQHAVAGVLGARRSRKLAIFLPRRLARLVLLTWCTRLSASVLTSRGGAPSPSAVCGECVSVCRLCRSNRCHFFLLWPSTATCAEDQSIQEHFSVDIWAASTQSAPVTSIANSPFQKPSGPKLCPTKYLLIVCADCDFSVWSERHRCITPCRWQQSSHTIRHIDTDTSDHTVTLVAPLPTQFCTTLLSFPLITTRTLILSHTSDTHLYYFLPSIWSCAICAHSALECLTHKKSFGFMRPPAGGNNSNQPTLVPVYVCVYLPVPRKPSKKKISVSINQCKRITLNKVWLTIHLNWACTKE